MQIREASENIWPLAGFAKSLRLKLLAGDELSTKAQAPHFDHF